MVDGLVSFSFAGGMDRIEYLYLQLKSVSLKKLQEARNSRDALLLSIIHFISITVTKFSDV